MNKLKLLPLLLLPFAYACNNEKAAPAVISVPADSMFLPVKYDYTKLEGVYTGGFDGSDIHVSLRHVNGRRAVGYSMYKGVRRNFSGIMQAGGLGFRFRVSEPGNNPYDGVFNFELDTTKFTISGTWTPNDEAKLSTKTYELTRIWDSIDQFTPPVDDSAGAFTFENDGTCLYETYQDSLHSAPQVVHGNWKKDGDDLLIFWEPNSIFPDKRSVLKGYRNHQDDGSYSYIEYYMLGDRKLIPAHE